MGTEESKTSLRAKFKKAAWNHDYLVKLLALFWNAITLPPAHLVPELVEGLCDYVNENWKKKTPLHLSAYVMWRLNWIHPFDDGNGRTSRIVSYVVLMISSDFILPGTPTIPDQIVSDRRGYFNALDQADEAGRLDVTAMEELLSGMLARQLASFYQSAGGKLPNETESLWCRRPRPISEIAEVTENPLSFYTNV
jgi:Fic family protein